jgi:hypothetical protein
VPPPPPSTPPPHTHALCSWRRGTGSDDETRELEAAAIAKRFEAQRVQLQEEKRAQAKEDKIARLTGGRETIAEARKRKADVKRLKMLVLTGQVDDAARAIRTLSLRDGK